MRLYIYIYICIELFFLLVSVENSSLEWRCVSTLCSWKARLNFSAWSSRLICGLEGVIGNIIAALSSEINGWSMKSTLESIVMSFFHSSVRSYTYSIRVSSLCVILGQHGVTKMVAWRRSLAL